jgi:hypothetical protein
VPRRVRPEAGINAGPQCVHVPGVYAALLAHERGKWADPHYWDPRWMRKHHSDGWYCGMEGLVCEHEPPPPQYRRGRSLLDELEASKPVTVARSYLGGDHTSGKHWPGPPPELPWGRGVRKVRISPDDVVQPAQR